MKAIMKKFSILALVLALGVLPRAGTSEDIELFTSNPAMTGTPNILIIVDNSANWNQPFEMEKATLVSVINGLDDRFNVGLMTVVQTSLDTSWPSRPNIEGSYMRFGVRNMNATNKNALSTLVGNWSNTTDNLTGDKGNNIFYGITMAEAYFYFAGADSYSGYDQNRRDYAGNTVYNPLAASLPVNAWSAKTVKKYTSPINADNNCAKNYIIFLSNGPANDKQATISESVLARNFLAAAGGNTSIISLNPGGLQGSYADEWARFLYATDVAPGVTAKQNIITYTVDIPPSQGYDADHTALLKSMANQGHGRYFAASDASSLSTVLKTIFNEIQAVDSVFAAVSLPVTVNVRGSYLNQVYMGVFRPDGDASPRWPGNLKQYKVGYDAATFTARLEDKLNQPIESSTTGFINPDVVSFWTTPSTFWDFRPSGTPLSGSDSPDGAVVEKGGAAQRLRTTYATDQTTRKLYTTAGLTNGALLSTALFNISNTTGVTACDLKIVSPVSAGLVRSATSVTASYTAPSGCNFADGQIVKVASAGDPAYDGYYTASAVTATSLKFTVPTTPAYPEAGSYPTDTSHLIYVSTAVPTEKTITSIWSNTTTVFINVAAHGLTQASPVTISGSPQTKFNVSCTASVVDANNLTCLATATNKSKSIEYGGTLSYTGSANRDVINLTRTEPSSGTSAVVTATTATAHGISNGATITVSGASGAAYNGTFSVTSVPTTTTLTYNIAVGPATPSTASISAGSTTRDNLINWVRGQDNAADENNNASYTDIRASAHGDVLHSRPAVVNYGRFADDIVVYYGANDGIFHAVKGGRDDSDGNEKWGVIFPEFFGNLDRLRSQMPAFNYSGTPVVPRPYFADGPVGVYVKDTNSNNMLGDTGDIANLYIGMRRGGRFIYALDVNNPDVPKLLWNKNNTNSGFSDLGQTWSEPKMGKLDAASGVSDPVIIFGAGYDPEHEDTLPATDNDKGRGVFILNAITGAVVKQFGTTDGMTCSFPADVMVLDRNSDGYSDRVYAGDTCGNLWRMDISGAISTWSAYKIAAIGGATKTDTDARKFLNAPSVVYGSEYDAILIGTGDREHPFDLNIQNYFYMFKDTNTGLTGGALNITAECSATSTNLYDATPNSIQSTDLVTSTAAQSALNAAKGWCIQLDEGEKVVGNATTVLGVTYFGTNLPLPPNTDYDSFEDENHDGVDDDTIPDREQCKSNLGEARLYAINFKDASIPMYYNSEGEYVPINDGSRYVEVVGGGLPPSPVGVQVVTDTGQVVTGVISGTKLLTPPGTGRRTRVYWYREME